MSHFTIRTSAARIKRFGETDTLRQALEKPLTNETDPDLS